MKHRLAILFLVASAIAASARQASGPTIEVELDKADAIPGQMISLRMTVLVPTYMPKPPVWPTLEMPNLLVLLPERSTNPVSRTVGGETWAGVTRNYRLSPMLAGQYVLPPKEIVVTYADPETNAPMKATLTTDEIRFSGVIPEIARGLDPFIAANSLELSQDISGTPQDMKPGDSVTRMVTATVDGVPPMFIPSLMPEMHIDGVAIYGDEPVLEERSNRGEYGGKRIESATLLAEGGTSGEVPAVVLDWYNLKSNKVETARLDGFGVTVIGPPASRAEPRDWRLLILAAGAVALAAFLVIWLLSWLVAPTRAWLQNRRQTWLASEEYAYRQVLRSAASHNYVRLLPALDDWSRKRQGPDPRQDSALQEAVVTLGSQRYGNAPRQDVSEAWSSLSRTLKSMNRASKERFGKAAALPPLNRLK